MKKQTKIMSSVLGVVAIGLAAAIPVFATTNTGANNSVETQTEQVNTEPQTETVTTDDVGTTGVWDAGNITEVKYLTNEWTDNGDPNNGYKPDGGYDSVTYMEIKDESISSEWNAGTGLSMNWYDSETKEFIHGFGKTANQHGWRTEKEPDGEWTVWLEFGINELMRTGKWVEGEVYDIKIETGTGTKSNAYTIESFEGLHIDENSYQAYSTPGNEDSITLSFEYDNGTHEALATDYEIVLYADDGTTVIDTISGTMYDTETMPNETAYVEETFTGLDMDTTYNISAKFYNGDGKWILETPKIEFTTGLPTTYTVNVIPQQVNSPKEYNEVKIELSGQVNKGNVDADYAIATVTNSEGELIGQPTTFDEVDSAGNLEDAFFYVPYLPGEEYHITIDYFASNGQLIDTQEEVYDGIIDPGYLTFDFGGENNMPTNVNITGFEWPQTNIDNGFAVPEYVELHIQNESNQFDSGLYTAQLDPSTPDAPITFNVSDFTFETGKTYSFQATFYDANDVVVGQTEETTLEAGLSIVKGAATVSNLNADGTGALVEVQGFSNNSTGDYYETATLSMTANGETTDLETIDLVDENGNPIVDDTYSFEVQEDQLPKDTAVEFNITYKDADTVLEDTQIDVWQNQTFKPLSAGNLTVDLNEENPNYVDVTVNDFINGVGMDEASTAVLLYSDEEGNNTGYDVYKNINSDTTTFDFTLENLKYGSTYEFVVVYLNDNGEYVGMTESTTYTTQESIIAGNIEILTDGTEYNMIEGIKVTGFENETGYLQAHTAKVYVSVNGTELEMPIETVDVSTITSGDIQFGLDNYEFEYGNRYSFRVVYEGYDQLGNKYEIAETETATVKINSKLDLGEVEYTPHMNMETGLYDSLTVNISGISDEFAPSKEAGTRVTQVKLEVKETTDTGTEVIYSELKQVLGGVVQFNISDLTEGSTYEFKFTYYDQNYQVIPAGDEESITETYVLEEPVVKDLNSGTLEVHSNELVTNGYIASVEGFENGTDDQEAETATLYTRATGTEESWEVIAIDNNLEDGVTFTSSLDTLETSEFYVEFEDDKGEVIAYTNTAVLTEDTSDEPVDPIEPAEPVDDGLSGGAIAGIVVGSVAGAALLGGLGWYFYKKNKK